MVVKPPGEESHGCTEIDIWALNPNNTLRQTLVHPEDKALKRSSTDRQTYSPKA